MARRYLSIRLGNSFYASVLTEESSSGVRVVEKKMANVNRENLSENGIDRDALKSILIDSQVREYIVLLPHMDVITGILEFPLTDRKKIENALRFELENEVMDSVEDILFDYTILNNARSRTQIAYFTVRKERINAILSELQMIGIDPACLFCPQNAYSGLYKLIFEKNSKGVKLIVELTDNILTLSFVDNLGYSVGRSLIIPDSEDGSTVIRNFIITTLQYYKNRAFKDIVGTYIVTDDNNSELLMNIFYSDPGIKDVNRLILKDSEEDNLDEKYALPFAVSLGISELTKSDCQF